MEDDIYVIESFQRMRKISARILLVLVLLSLVAISCALNENIDFLDLFNLSNDNRVDESNQYSLQTLYATATLGAEQFHIQLTAMANQNK